MDIIANLWANYDSMKVIITNNKGKNLKKQKKFGRKKGNFEKNERFETKWVEDVMKLLQIG
jgi:hypothetical protein